ncbi:uncharacterized protein DS421_7g212370 [Arachis hypogaea]|nr:uncharacterized protein DS421_7g212370 [Arachis hypogaea]
MGKKLVSTSKKNRSAQRKKREKIGHQNVKKGKNRSAHKKNGQHNVKKREKNRSAQRKKKGEPVST